MTAEAYAARAVLRTAQERVPRPQIWWTIDNVVLATWISRHLSAPEALSVALSQMPFTPRIAGIDPAARQLFAKSPDDLDAEETAELLALSSQPLLVENPEELRKSRDALLRKLHVHGVIDEPTMLAAMQRDVRRFK